MPAGGKGFGEDGQQLHFAAGERLLAECLGRGIAMLVGPLPEMRQAAPNDHDRGQRNAANK